MQCALYYTAGKSVLSRDFVMARLNINSQMGHMEDLRTFMNQWTNIGNDILAINETKLDSALYDNEVYLPGFDILELHTVNT